MENRRITVNGIQMGVTLYGEPHKHQKTLVLLHGFTGCAANWADVCGRLGGTEGISYDTGKESEKGISCDEGRDGGKLTSLHAGPFERQAPFCRSANQPEGSINRRLPPSPFPQWPPSLPTLREISFVHPKGISLIALDM